MNKIHSIVVLYNPTADNIENYKEIALMSDKLILIDNSNRITTFAGNDEKNIEYVKNDENIGLSKALNLGIRKCLNNADCTHIALFDQDSIPDKNMFMRLIEELNKSDQKVVTVSPQILDVKNKSIKIVNETEIVDVVITSGSLYPKQAFEKVGLMDETLFIDYIDYEWCLRAKSKGFKIVRVNGAHLYHNMGDSFIDFFGTSKPIHTNKLRHYYIVRNQLIMLSRDYISVKWKCVHTFKLFYRIPSYIILSNEKWITFKFILKAIKEAFVNRKDYKEIKY